MSKFVGQLVFVSVSSELSVLQWLRAPILGAEGGISHGMEEDVVAAPCQCSRSRKRNAWETWEIVARERTESLRQCGRDLATYIAKCRDGTDAFQEGPDHVDR